MKKYVRPTIEIVKLQNEGQLLAGSTNGLNDHLQDTPEDEQVEEGW